VLCEAHQTAFHPRPFAASGSVRPFHSLLTYSFIPLQAVAGLSSAKPESRRPTKTSRIELRASENDSELLDKAAAALGTDRNSLLVGQGA
jgi:hypothetical protein